MGLKERADVLVVTQGFASSREVAKRRIMAGEIWWQGPGGPVRVEKPGQMLPLGAILSATGGARFVSRGGDKLLSALEGLADQGWALPLEGWVALDAGASTGGFTDCLLQHGVARVYSVDVGHGQLHQRLRQDPRVVVMEGVNLRYAAADLIPEAVDLVVADCSFISLRHILPACLQWLRPGGMMVALVKPQFELGPQYVGKGGIVRDPALHQVAVERVQEAARSLGLVPLAVLPSAVRGAKGNQEYFVVFRREEA